VKGVEDGGSDEDLRPNERGRVDLETKKEA